MFHGVMSVAMTMETASVSEISVGVGGLIRQSARKILQNWPVYLQTELTRSLNYE